MTRRIIPAAVVNDIKRLTEESRTQARGGTQARGEEDSRFAAVVLPLADALDHVAELLDYHQDFLLNLRAWKADAR